MSSLGWYSGGIFKVTDSLHTFVSAAQPLGSHLIYLAELSSIGLQSILWNGSFGRISFDLRLRVSSEWAALSQYVLMPLPPFALGGY